MVKDVVGKFWVLFGVITVFIFLILLVIYGVTIGVLFSAKLIATVLLGVSLSLFLYDLMTGKYESCDSISKKDIISFINLLASVLFFGWYAYS